jgi:A/G-specific adenine glycosylase
MTLADKKKRIQARLLRWFKKNQRGLPWRRTKDPYAVWISEIMLQQTQVATVIPYYEKFLKAFPTVRHLAKADLSEVLKVWEGLGYYSRARNLHRTSRIILNHFSGVIPDNRKDLLNLPGVGRYTAGAILSIAYNKEAPILDGNVKRVLSRLFAISGNPVKGETEGLLWQLSELLIPKGKASLFNQALMDLGAMTCTPKDPECLKCPLCGVCKGYASGKPERFPSKAVKKGIPHIEAVAAVIRKNGKVLIQQRPSKGLLGGLWEFPNWPLDGKKGLMEHLKQEVKGAFGLKVKCEGSFGTFKQAYSHFKLTLHVFDCYCLNRKTTGRWIPSQKLRSFPLSRIHRKIAEKVTPHPSP